jgi:hypothetical protein
MPRGLSRYRFAGALMGPSISDCMLPVTRATMFTSPGVPRKKTASCGRMLNVLKLWNRLPPRC